MNAYAITQPAFALAVLTFVVYVVMMVRRLGTMRRQHIDPQRFASPAGVVAAIPDTRASDNYRNLFEMPVLFYAAIGIAALLSASTTTMVLAWLYVALRAVHSLIHCTYNRVTHRFAAFVLSAIVLAALWVDLFVRASRFY